MSRKGRSTKIEGITKRQRPNHSRNVLVVERNGATHQLALIHVAELDLLFGPTSGFRCSEDGRSRKLQELPLILADSRR